MASKQNIDDLLADAPEELNGGLISKFETAAAAAEGQHVRVVKLLTTDKTLQGQGLQLKHSHPVFEAGEFNAVITSEQQIIIE